MVGACLQQAYVSKEAIGDELVGQIVRCAEGHHAAIASILWSEPAHFTSKSTDFW